MKDNSYFEKAQQEYANKLKKETGLDVMNSVKDCLLVLGTNSHQKFDNIFQEFRKTVGWITEKHAEQLTEITDKFINSLKEELNTKESNQWIKIFLRQ